MKQGLPINPALLTWARETAGYTLEEELEKKEYKKLAQWERGEIYPSYSQLEKLAKRYKRPLAVFCFPEPPKEERTEQALQAFRSSGCTPNKFKPKIRFLLRSAQAFQLKLKALHNNQDDTQKAKLSWLQCPFGQSIPILANHIREELRADLAIQKGCKNEDDALTYWREILAQHGVYIFKGPFGDYTISGFCLHDDLFPIIYLNSSMSKTRQIFTIFHELAHLLLKEDYLVLNSTYNQERECDFFAANFLVPDSDFDKEVQLSTITDTDELKKHHHIKELANRYKVSEAVILIKLRYKKQISQEYCDKELLKLSTSFSQKVPRIAGGGNSDYNHLSYLGRPYTRLVFEKYYQGKISQSEGANYLNIKVVSFDKKTKKVKRIFDRIESIFSLREYGNVSF